MQAAEHAWVMQGWRGWGGGAGDAGHLEGHPRHRASGCLEGGLWVKAETPSCCVCALYTRARVYWFSMCHSELVLVVGRSSSPIRLYQLHCGSPTPLPGGQPHVRRDTVSVQLSSAKGQGQAPHLGPPPSGFLLSPAWDSQRVATDTCSLRQILFPKPPAHSPSCVACSKSLNKKHPWSLCKAPRAVGAAAQ